MQTIAPAPRRVPLSLRLINLSNGFAQLGWGLFGFGMIFAWVFTFNGDYSFLTFRGPHPTVDGKVLAVEPTGASENEIPIQAYVYQFPVAGVQHSGTSYSTSASASAGDVVTIEYEDGNPARSRIEGMRRAQFSPLVGLVNIFPLVGLGLLIPAVLKGRTRNQLLREGVLVTGKLTSKRSTNIRINRRLLYELRFEFTARDGRRYEAKARSTDTRRLEDDADEALLYDPDHPTRAYVLDEAPARPKFDPAGDLLGNPLGAIRAMILPTLVILVHGAIFVSKFGIPGL